MSKNNRPHRMDTLALTAEIWANRSTCDRLHVGVVIHREGRILVQGYNGAPAGLPHCNHDCDCDKHLPPYADRDFHVPGCNSEKPCTMSVHAEQNAISWAARHGVALDGAEMVVTHMPCYTCALSIVNAGISKVHFGLPYRMIDGVELLVSAGVEVGQYPDPNASFSDRV